MTGTNRFAMTEMMGLGMREIIGLALRFGFAVGRPLVALDGIAALRSQ